MAGSVLVSPVPGTGQRDLATTLLTFSIVEDENLAQLEGRLAAGESSDASLIARVLASTPAIPRRAGLVGILLESRDPAVVLLAESSIHSRGQFFQEDIDRLGPKLGKLRREHPDPSVRAGADQALLRMDPQAWFDGLPDLTLLPPDDLRRYLTSLPHGPPDWRPTALRILDHLAKFHHDLQGRIEAGSLAARWRGADTTRVPDQIRYRTF